MTPMAHAPMPAIQHPTRWAAEDGARPGDRAFVAERMLRHFADPSYRPPLLPSAAFEVSDLARRSEVNVEEIVRVIERDPLLASHVLKAAQSPMYTTRIPVQSIPEAVRRLGLNAMRDVVWQVAVDLRLFRAGRYTAVMKSLRRHSAATAQLMRLVCSYAAVEADLAFLCGLLHDIGMCGLLIALSEETPHQAPAPEILWPVLREVHPAASAQMARLWKLDATIQLVLGGHHNAHEDRFAHPLIAALCVADTFAEDLGFGATAGLDASVNADPASDRWPADAHDAALRLLRIDPALHARLSDEAVLRLAAQEAT